VVWGLDARNAIRPNAPLHWDGLNTSVHEVVISSALGDGANAKGYDWHSSDRIEHFLRTTAPPPSPLKTDAALAQRGQAVFAASCAECHAKGGARTLTVIPLAELGTDPHRDAMWTTQARDTYNNYREGYDWGFKSFQKMDGYVAETLDALWLRGPYLHNASVPTVADLLEPAEQRPRFYLRQSTTIDQDRLGFVTGSCDPAHPPRDGFCYDTTQPGNANGGHLYGTTLAPDDKQALLEYLKTL
jgi:mono/diheme cytochrome c family protein